jgi:hypothetical protein
MGTEWLAPACHPRGQGFRTRGIVSVGIRASVTLDARKRRPTTDALQGLLDTRVD